MSAAGIYSSGDVQGYSTYFKSPRALGSPIPTAEEIYNNETAYGLPITYNEITKQKLALKDENGNTITEITQSGTYTQNYRFLGQSPTPGVQNTPSYEITVSYTFTVIKNRLPLKKWTITDVIVRACDLIEPLRYGEKPRFRLDGVNYDNMTGNALSTYTSGSQAEEFDKIISPEFAFTKMTFREQMQKVGGYIHGEFRITRIEYENSRPVFYFAFDKYGGIKKIPDNARIKGRYIYAGFKTDINDYCTSLDSSAENLINQLDWAQGVIVDPFNGGHISLRAESTAIRLEENDATVIPTIKQIHHFGKSWEVNDGLDGGLYCYVPKKGQEYNITPYLFEKANYDLLSSYSGTYPYCKAYALYYSIGEKNIKGLFYKSPHAVSGIFSNYAILNILRAVSGDDSLSFTVNENVNEYMTLSFRIVYTPIYNERIKTNKAVIVNGLPRSLAYNQSANIIESRYYGEHLKGVVARLGNVEKTYTYNLAFLSDVPKAGMLFDKNYYISTVSTEFLPTHIKCTIGLSKDFNRLSQYVGINSEMRMWEVSERQAVARDTVITEYLVCSKTAVYGDSDTAFSASYLGEYLFKKNYNSSVAAPVSAVNVKRLNKSQVEESAKVSLPVISAASGNSMIFTFSFADNYSAGQKVNWVNRENAKAVSGYFADYVSYCDYYGRFWYLDMEFMAGKAISPSEYNDAQKTYTQKLPNVELENSSSNEYLPISLRVKYRKDSREVPQVSYSLTAVSENDDLIIGSAMMSNSWLVNALPKNIKLAFFSEEISNVSSLIDITKRVQNYGYGTFSTTYIPFGHSLSISLTKPSGLTDSGYKSWALITEGSTTKIHVEDDDGKPTTQDIVSGNELIIGGNGKMPSNIYMAVKQQIYQ